jgi:uncharacterized membrane protein
MSRGESEPLTPDLSDQDRILLLFAYLGPLALVALVASRRELVKWHAKQGLLLNAALVALYLVLKPVHFLLARSHRNVWLLLGELYWALAGLLAVGAFVLLLLCVVRALEGERFKVPLIGDLADRF